MKYTEMELQIITFAKGIIPNIIKVCTLVHKKIIALMAFFGTVGLASIAPLIHLTIVFVLIDMLFGLAVTIYKKGWNHIMSCRLRDSLIKIFFYLVIIIGLFAIETVLVDGYAITAKLAFAVITATELWSIIANMLILFPNLPALNLLKKYLTKEIAKKLGEENIENIEETLNKGETENEKPNIDNK